jgi:hypothetical protein
MNKRMREPFHTLIWEASIGYNDSWSQVDPEVLEKFAELIVWKCCDIAYEHDAPKMSGPGMIIAGRIKQHFGVEQDLDEDSDETCPRCGEEWLALCHLW